MRIAVLGLLVACGDNSLAPCESWRQWGNDSAHDGATCSAGQPLDRVIAGRVFDPFTQQEAFDAGGDLVAHYQAPLIDGDHVFMMTKSGTYTPCETMVFDGKPYPDCFEPDEEFRLNTQVWNENRLAPDNNGGFAVEWTFASDWKPEPYVGFEPMFQPALIGDRIAVPGANGSVWLLDSATGKVVRHAQLPVGTADTYVAGALAVAGDTLYYNAIQLDHDMPFGMPARAWLVAIDGDGDGLVRFADYAHLVPGAPAPDDMCFYTYDQATTPLPWPPLDATGTPMPPPQHYCGGQRPGINSALAIDGDGTIYAATRAHYAGRYSYLVAITPELRPKWATSLRDLARDACGVLVPDDATAMDSPYAPLHCTPGTPLGVEPATGLPPAWQVDDSSSSSPVALPGGGVVYGAYSGYNSFRGHLVALGPTGKLLGTYDFGWDTTPAVVAGGTSFRIVLKDNHYVFDADGNDLGPYFITALDAKLQPVWQFQSTETQSCERQPDGSLACSEDHPHGFEWCINAPAVDRDGVTYVNSEDGNLYAIGPDGQLRERLFMQKSIGAAYTPLALDHDGRIFSLNNGVLQIVGR